jgi:hypothetical protein
MLCAACSDLLVFDQIHDFLEANEKAIADGLGDKLDDYAIHGLEQEYDRYHDALNFRNATSRLVQRPWSAKASLKRSVDNPIYHVWEREGERRWDELKMSAAWNGYDLREVLVGMIQTYMANTNTTTGVAVVETRWHFESGSPIPNAECVLKLKIGVAVEFCEQSKSSGQNSMDCCLFHHRRFFIGSLHNDQYSELDAR